MNMHDIDTEQITYTVHKARWLHFYAVCSFLLTLLGIAATIEAWHEGVAKQVFAVSFGCFFLLITLMLECAIKNRCLFVLRDGQDFIYRNLFGKETRFSVYEISHVVLESNGGHDETLRILNKDERLLCKLEMNMVSADRLLSDLKGKGIPVREAEVFDRLMPRAAAFRRRVEKEKELALEAMPDAEYEKHARGAKRMRTASIIMQVVSVILALFMILSSTVTFDQMSLFFACWPIVFLIFGILLGHGHYNMGDPSYLRKHGATKRYIETAVPFPFLGIMVYALICLLPGRVINAAKEWKMICFVLLEMAIVLLIFFLVYRRRISVSTTIVLVFLVFLITFPHTVYLNWTLGTKHFETAWVERTEIVNRSRSISYYIYVDDGNGESVRYTATPSIVYNKQAGDAVKLLISDSVFGLRQIVVIE
ncbi:MAG: hypothetical protein K5637_05790 [Lachnospiraceae bacterium]|nr:hypothetical protein [Lachnospiraceae bacterium]